MMTRDQYNIEAAENVVKVRETGLKERLLRAGRHLPFGLALWEIFDTVCPLLPYAISGTLRIKTGSVTGKPLLE